MKCDGLACFSTWMNILLFVFQRDLPFICFLMHESESFSYILWRSISSGVLIRLNLNTFHCICLPSNIRIDRRLMRSVKTDLSASWKCYRRTDGRVNRWTDQDYSYSPRSASQQGIKMQKHLPVHNDLSVCMWCDRDDLDQPAHPCRLINKLIAGHANTQINLHIYSIWQGFSHISVYSCGASRLMRSVIKNIRFFFIRKFSISGGIFFNISE